MTRNVVLVQSPGSDQDLASVLAEHHWQPCRVAQPHCIDSSLNGHRCHVGVVVFDESLKCSPGEFAAMASMRAIEWIAVLPDGKTRDPLAARALASGFFFDYHTLPVDRTRLVHCVGHAYGKALLRRSLASQLNGDQGHYGMIGRSARMLTLYAQLEKIMAARASVLITGESGVGKELAALAIHRGSNRAAGPFVPVNCGALPESLIESLLFGHERGSFTGAHERHIGCIEAAHRGTIFLDEIGDLPLIAQASLLRFLQESTVVRVGSMRSLQIDTRVIAATNMDLRAAVRAGQFRDDLFYRLNVLRVEVPALREREDDCLLLAEHFLLSQQASRSTNVHGFAEDAVKALRRHAWPGNVRELINRIQHAMIMCDGPLIRASDLQLDDRSSPSGLLSLAKARSGIEKDIVESALIHSDHNIAAAARQLGIARVTLYRLLRRLHIAPRPGGAGNGKTKTPRKKKL